MNLSLQPKQKQRLLGKKTLSKSAIEVSSIEMTGYKIAGLFKHNSIAITTIIMTINVTINANIITLSLRFP